MSWNPEDETSTAQARAEFERLAADGYEMFRKTAKSRRRVKAFDPRLGEILAAPGVQTKTDRKQGTRQAAMAGGPNPRTVESFPR